MEAIGVDPGQTIDVMEVVRVLRDEHAAAQDGIGGDQRVVRRQRRSVPGVPRHELSGQPDDRIGHSRRRLGKMCQHSQVADVLGVVRREVPEDFLNGYFRNGHIVIADPIDGREAAGADRGDHTCIECISRHQARR